MTGNFSAGNFTNGISPAGKVPLPNFRSKLGFAINGEYYWLQENGLIGIVINGLFNEFGSNISKIATKLFGISVR